MKPGALGLILAVLLLAGCGQDLAGTVVPTRTLVPLTATPTALPPTATPTHLPPPAPADLATATGQAVTIPAQAQIVLGLVIDHLAARLDVPAEAIGVWGVEHVTWPDANLGCEGMEDAFPDEDNQVEGYRITLTHGGEQYVYHADRTNRFDACTGQVEPVAGEPVILDPVVNSLVDQASRALAAELDLPQRRVFLVEVTPYEWPDSSLGCPLPDQEYVATPALGYRIVLRVGQTPYYYHADFRHAFQCSEESERLPESASTATAPAATVPVATVPGTE
ncbi:MAG: hypothetical protein JW910_20825 [Anaerolineae bacterium]|nr:hypothetical protein [Anaerolineae bacterium]